MVIKPQFEEAVYFSEGLARVTIDGKWGYIDRAGNIVIQPEYRGQTGRGFFVDGLAAVRIGSAYEYGYIDQTGKLIIEAQYDFAGDFINGLARIKIGDRWGILIKLVENLLDHSLFLIKNSPKG